MISERADPANARLGAHSVSGQTLRRHLRGCGDGEVFSSYLPRPNATLFVVTRPFIHNAMSILVPERWIFIVKTDRAFSYSREQGCRLKRNIPRKIKSDGLLCKVLVVEQPPWNFDNNLVGIANRC